MDKVVAVLYGGWSAERSVSLESGRAVAQAARELGHTVKEIDVQRDLTKLVQDLTPKPDVVINVLHGKWGEDGRIQSVLDILEIPYTYSNHLSSAVAMDKTFARNIMASMGLPVAEGREVSYKTLNAKAPMAYPFVMKPPCEGSSLGVFIVEDDASYENAKQKWTYGDRVLVEDYIPGREISTAMVGDKAMGTLELCPKDGFYDFEAKYTDGKTVHKMPAPLEPDIYQRSLDLAERAQKALGCTGVSRVDMRYNENNKEQPLTILEVNTQPGMVPLSIVPEVVAHSGMSFNDLVQWMIENATCHG